MLASKADNNRASYKASSLYRGLKKAKPRTNPLSTREVARLLVVGLADRLRMFPLDRVRRVTEWDDLISPYEVPRIGQRVLTFPRGGWLYLKISTSENIH